VEIIGGKESVSIPHFGKILHYIKKIPKMAWKKGAKKTFTTIGEALELPSCSPFPWEGDVEKGGTPE